MAIISCELAMCHSPLYQQSLAKESSTAALEQRIKELEQLSSELYNFSFANVSHVNGYGAESEQQILTTAYIFLDGM